MRINLAESWSVKCSKKKILEGRNMPYAINLADGSDEQVEVRYLKQFKINAPHGVEKAQAKKRKYFLEFEAVNANATILLNGKKIAEHKGSFLPFSVDITKIINFNTVNKLQLAVDNRPQNDILGLGKTKSCEYNSTVGIVGDVWLNIKESTSFAMINDSDDCFVYTEKVQGEDKKYNICANCHIVNGSYNVSDLYVLATLYDAGMNEITSTKAKFDELASENEVTVKIPVEDAILWSPEYPYLYNVKLELFVSQNGEDDILLDTLTYKKGIREFSVDNGKFYINGEQFKIKGVCHHQEYPVIGMLTSKRAEYREILKLKNAGFNTIRLVLYPATKEFCQACDALGMLVIDCVPSNGTFFTNNAFKKSVVDAYTKLAYRDRNYTSVAMWEATVFETSKTDGLSDEMVLQNSEIIKSAYVAGNAPLIVGDTIGRENPAELNYDIAYCSYDAENKKYYLPEGISAGLISKFGSEGFSDSFVENKGEEFVMASQAWCYQYISNSNEHIENCVGAVVEQDINYTYVNKSTKNVPRMVDFGVMTQYRLPKTSYYFFKSQDTKEKNKMVYMPSKALASLVEKMPIYTNCDSINLYVDDEFIGKYNAEKGEYIPYENDAIKGAYKDFINSHIFDGSNSDMLDFAPVMLDSATVSSGVIRVDGVQNDEVVVSQVINNVGELAGLKIFVDYCGLALQNDERDFVFVHVATVDAEGNIVKADGLEVTLAVKGGETLADDYAKTVNGVASFMVRAYAGVDKVMLKAFVDKKKTPVASDYAKIIVKG